MARGRTALLVLALGTGGPPGLPGQAVPDSLTLADALRLARSSSPGFLQAANDVAVAEAEERQGLGQFLPALDVQWNTSGNSSRRVTGEDDYGQPTELPQAINYRGSSTSQGVSLGMTLFDGGANLARLGATRARTDAAEADVEAAWARIRAEVVNAYDAVVEADRKVELAARLLESARERLAATEARLRLAVVGPVDVLGAQVDVAGREQELAQARGDARKARLGMLEMLGVGGEAAFQAVSAPPPVFDPAELDREALIARARDGSPRIAAREAQLVAARRSASAQRRGRWPTLTAGLSLGRSMALSSYEALTEFNPQNRSFSFNFGARLPLFDGFQRGAAVAQAEAQAEDAGFALRAERLAVEREVRSALIDLENAHASLLLAERTAQLSLERLELAQEQYRLGNLSFIELQNLTDQAAQAERQAVEARFAFERARVALEQSVGQEVGR